MAIYLKECVIESVGPIKSLDVIPSFNPDGLPKPLVLVGKNGTGKSILLSYIVDALFEFAKKAYQDVVPDQLISSPFFKISGSINQRSDCNYSIGLLKFVEGEKDYLYLDKSGSLDAKEYKSKMQGRFESILSWKNEENVIKKA